MYKLQGTVFSPVPFQYETLLTVEEQEVAAAAQTKGVLLSAALQAVSTASLRPLFLLTPVSFFISFGLLPTSVLRYQDLALLYLLMFCFHFVVLPKGFTSPLHFSLPVDLLRAASTSLQIATSFSN